MAKTRRGFALYGKCDEDTEAWRKCSDECIALANRYGVPLTDYGIDTYEKGDDVLRRIGGIGRKFNNNIKLGRTIHSMELLRLPEMYNSPMSDDLIDIIRTTAYREYGNKDIMSAYIRKEVYEERHIDDDEVMEMLSRHISASSGEIFEVTYPDDPHLYATRSNPVNSFKTLKVLKTYKF